MVRVLFSVLTILVLCGAFAYGQHGAIDETIDNINKLLGGKTIVSLEKEELIVKVYKNERLFRRDRAYVTHLNADATEYLPDEWSIVLRCTRKAADCVDRRLYVHKKRQQYSRLTILIKGNEGVKNDLIDNFKTLLMLCQE